MIDVLFIALVLASFTAAFADAMGELMHEDERVRVRWVSYARPRWLARTFYGAGVPDNVRRDPRACWAELVFGTKA